MYFPEREALKRAALDALDAAPWPLSVAELWALVPQAPSDGDVPRACRELSRTGEVTEWPVDVRPPVKPGRPLHPAAKHGRELMRRTMLTEW